MCIWSERRTITRQLRTGTNPHTQSHNHTVLQQTRLVRPAVDVVVQPFAQHLQRLAVQEEARAARVEDLLLSCLVLVYVHIYKAKGVSYGGKKYTATPHSNKTQTTAHAAKRHSHLLVRGQEGPAQEDGLGPVARRLQNLVRQQVLAEVFHDDEEVVALLFLCGVWVGVNVKAGGLRFFFGLVVCGWV